MKTIVFFSALLFSALGFSQTATPFDTLKVSSSVLIENGLQISTAQIAAIDHLNEKTKDYVIKVFAEEKPNSPMFNSRIEDIKKHRDYKLKRILSEDQFTTFLKRVAIVSGQEAAVDRL